MMNKTGACRPENGAATAQDSFGAKVDISIVPFEVSAFAPKIHAVNGFTMLPRRRMWGREHILRRPDLEVKKNAAGDEIRMVQPNLGDRN